MTHELKRKEMTTVVFFWNQFWKIKWGGRENHPTTEKLEVRILSREKYGKKKRDREQVFIQYKNFLS